MGEYFQNPGFLLALPVPVAFIWWRLRRRRAALRYSSLFLLVGLPEGRAFWATWGAAILRGVAVLSALLAASGPRIPDQSTPLQAQGISIMLVLDLSGSMETADFPIQSGGVISRLDAAKQAFRLFVKGGESPDGHKFEGRPQDRIGIVTFTSVPRTVCPMTLSHSVVMSILENQKVRKGLGDGTNIGDALAEAMWRLDQGGSGKKVIVLLSDGEHNVVASESNPSLSPDRAAQFAEGEVRIYTIDCGGIPPEGARAEERKQREDGRQVMQELAQATQGRMLPAGSLEEMRTACNEIDQILRHGIDSPKRRRYRDLFPYFATATVVILGFGSLMSRTWWRILP